MVYNWIGDYMNNEKFVPQWILDSKTAPHEVNKEADKIVGSYVAALMKRGFSQKEIGILMVQAFTLPVTEVEKRVDSVLSCAEEGEEESARRLCAFAVSKGHLFSGDESDPCGAIELLKEKYGKKATFETILTFPEILSVWKNEDVRNSEKYKTEKQKAEYILNEVADVFPEI